MQPCALLAEAYSGLAEVDDKDGHTLIACSSLAIARENQNGAKSIGADQKKRVLDRVENLSAHCPK